MSDSIRVVCRLRPLNKIQIANEGQQCVTYTDKNININVGGDQNKYSFAFDKIFGPLTQQISIYQQVAIPIIKSVISGFNGTIFAYGQTGGGKTWTMEGPNHHDPQFKGVIPRTIQGLFSSITQCDQNLQFLLKCSYVEIYNQKLFDLLDPSKARLQIKQDKQRGVFIQNCTQICVSSSDQMLKTMDSGSQNRKVAFTGMNQRSSRSHSLFIIHIYQKNLKKDSTKQTGSQKVGKTNVQGQQLQEAKNINKSLSSLGNVINALTSDKKQHIPYRDSKLTRILQESLGGNSKTTLIINCSMCTYNDRETLSTLRFGNRAKSIKNKPKVNQQKSVKQLMILLEAANKTINQLKLQVNGEYVPLVNKQQEKEQQQKDILINDLKVQLQANKKEQEERNREMQLRIKQLIVELSYEKQQKQRIQQKWKSIFNLLYTKLVTLNKLSKRSYLDLQFILNNIIINQQQTLPQAGKTIKSTLQNLQSFQMFYQQELKILFQQIIQQEKQQKQLQQQFQGNLFSSEKRNNKIALSQPVLHQIQEFDKQTNKSSQNLQMSMIVQKNISQQNSYSEKVSQQSIQIQTLLQSLQTKQSHKHYFQEMSLNLKNLKKQNQQLTKQCEKHQQQLSSLALKLQEKYEQKICDLQQRVHQYKNIIYQKDIQFTKKIDDIEKMKKKITDQKVQSDRLQKVIQTNASMKSISQLQNKVRSLASERQKIFNQLYNIRGELDDAQMSIKQKDQHIDSLKNVVKQLSKIPTHNYTPVEIEKTFNNQVYGTQNPQIIQTIKGGKQGKKSSLRKKTNSNFKKQREQPENQKKIIPFLKTLFK